MPLEAGTRIGKYEIESLIGEGGMGRVYRALDTELRRPVALKFLPEDIAGDRGRMQRFEQEALAASTLNHPNILTVHDIGQTADGRRFFASELVEGVTLRGLLSRGAPPLTEVLDIAAQVASALVAAHAKGIVHRDIKPENVMVRPDGYVKVLDFGLAKPTGRGAPAVDTQAATRALVNTDPGAVMGTVSYMSPEQARGDEVDARTDIWSLGVVLYEMVTGRVPFEGSTPSHAIVSILEKEPLPLRHYAPDAPEALEWVVTEALTKDREERTQTARELLKKLQRLKQKADAEAEIERSVVPESRADSAAPGGAPQAHAWTAQQVAAGTSPAAAGAQTASTGEVLAGEIKRHKAGVLVAAAAALCVLAAAGYGAYKLLGRAERPRPFQAFKLTRLTTSGKVTSAAISPDGRYVVHVADDGGQQSLWVRQTRTGSNVQIGGPDESRYFGLTFSPDGDYVYYVRQEPNSPLGVLHVVPALGGEPRKLIEDVDTVVTFSPDGRRLAFIRNYPGQGRSALVVADADGGGLRELDAREQPDFYPIGSGDGPAWSPDGKVIACTVGGTDERGRYEEVGLVPAEGGPARLLTGMRWYDLGKAAWLPDGSGLLVPGADTVAAFVYPQVWHISYPEGKAGKVTNDLNHYHGMSLRADASAFLTVQRTTVSNLWAAPGGEAGALRQVTSGGSKFDGIEGLAAGPDGRLVFRSLGGGSEDLWAVSLDGSGLRQLTANASANYLPAVTSDGRHLVFVSERTGTQQIWRADGDGSNPKLLSVAEQTGSAGEQTGLWPAVSPDGRWVVFYRAGRLWKVSMDGGEPAPLVGPLASKPAVSPDGKLIACEYRREGTTVFLAAVFPSEGGESPSQVFDLPRTWSRDAGFRWSPDGRSIHYVDTRGGVSNIWALPLAGGPARQVTNFKSERIFFFDWTPDGRTLVLSRGTVTTDAVLASAAE